jgi:hypothetical protein
MDGDYAPQTVLKGSWLDLLGVLILSRRLQRTPQVVAALDKANWKGSM